MSKKRIVVMFNIKPGADPGISANLKKLTIALRIIRSLF